MFLEYACRVAGKRASVVLVVLAALVFASPAQAQMARPTAAQIGQMKPAIAVLPSAPGAGLFSAPATPEPALNPAHVARARAIVIDPQYLAAMLAGDDLRVNGDRIAGSPVVYTLNLFDDVAVKIVKLGSTANEQGHTIWRGAVVGEDGEVTMVVNGPSVVIDIRSGSQIYRVQPMGGAEWVVEYDASSLPPTDVAPPRPPAPPNRSDLPNPGAAAAIPPAGSPVTINVVVAYTTAAAQQLGGAANASTQISSAISDLNQTLANSGLSNITVKLAGTAQVNYAENGAGSSRILDDATDGVGDFARIQQLRASQGADLLSVWTNFTDGCGLAWVNDTVTQNSLSFFAKFGVSVISTGFNLACIPSSATHEIGHNLGGQHDRYVEPNAVAGPAGFNYGYVDTVGKFRDTMAYSDECDALRISCPRIPYYSNPNVTYSSSAGPRPEGVPDSDPKAADVARKVSEIAPLISQFHTVASATSAGSLVAAILPGGRAVQVNTPATVFATIINTSATTLGGCSIAKPSTASASLNFTYQTTNPATNAVTGTANTPVSIGANGSQTFVLAMQSASPLTLASGALIFGCGAGQTAPTIAGVNTIDLVISGSPIADVIALSATASKDGIVTVPFSNKQAGAFSVASINIGKADTLRVQPDTGSATLPLALTVCQTNPSTGACLGNAAASVTTTINTSDTPTFAIFATTTAQIPFSPGTARIYLRFFDSGGGQHGSTSVAVKTS